MKSQANRALVFTVVMACLSICPFSVAQVRAAEADNQKADETPERSQKKQQDAAKQAAPAKLVPLNKAGTVLLDLPGKRLLLKSEVVLTEGLLEMLCCLSQTKEHESILSVDTRAQVVHAGLLALGAKPGTPVQFTETYQPPTGQPIDIFVQWTDDKGAPHRVRAQKWIQHATRRFYVTTMQSLPTGLKIPEDSNLRFDDRNDELVWFGPMSNEQRDQLLKLSTDQKYQTAIKRFHEQSQPKPMQANWVFAGSGFYEDKVTGDRMYQAEGGDLICVANFPSATIDVAIASSKDGENNLLFEANPEHIPPLGTKVTIELIPIFKSTKKATAPNTPAPASKKN